MLDKDKLEALLTQNEISPLSRIIYLLLNCKPLTVKQLADRLGRTYRRILPHITELRKAGLILGKTSELCVTETSSHVTVSVQDRTETSSHMTETSSPQIMQKTPVPKKPAQILKKFPVSKKPKILQNFSEPLSGSSSSVVQLNNSTLLPEYASTPALVRNIDRKTPEGSLEICIPNSYTKHTITSVISNNINKINNIKTNSYRAIHSATVPSTEENSQQFERERTVALMRKALEESEKATPNQEDQLLSDPEPSEFARSSKLSLVETDIGLIEMDLSDYEIVEEHDPEAIRKAKIAARMVEKRAELAKLPPEPDPDPAFQKALDEIAAFQYVPSDPNAPPKKKPLPVQSNLLSMRRPKVMTSEMREEFLREVREEREKAKIIRAEQEREWLEFLREDANLPN